MDLRYTPEEQAFREELRTWLGEVLPDIGPPPDRKDIHARRGYDTAWQRMLYDAGYAGINWPAEFGGACAFAGAFDIPPKDKRITRDQHGIRRVVDAVVKRA